MRGRALWMLWLVTLAGCSGETGAHLTLSAPAGPKRAGAFSLILAAPERIPTIADQRLAAGDLETRTVAYFLQRTSAGTSTDLIEDVDGYTIRLAPAQPAQDLIPFILLTDADARIVGIATYRANASSMPAPIGIRDDRIDKYTLEVEAVTQVDGDDVAPAPGQVQVVTCRRDGADAMFTSGIVWRPLGGGEYRLLLPRDGMDATGRPLDMDCDQHEVSVDPAMTEDCDDLRGAFHRGAPEACDGLDTNCDERPLITTACPSSNTCPGATGTAICNDATGEASDCYLPESCDCALGQACTVCVVPWAGQPSGGTVVPCQPSEGLLFTDNHCSDTAPCSVIVVNARNGWKVEVSPLEVDQWALRADGITGQVAVRAERPEGSDWSVPLSPSELGDVDLAIIAADGTIYPKGFALKLAGQSTTNDCGPAPATMSCFTSAPL